MFRSRFEFPTPEPVRTVNKCNNDPSDPEIDTEVFHSTNNRSINISSISLWITGTGIIGEDASLFQEEDDIKENWTSSEEPFEFISIVN